MEVRNQRSGPSHDRKSRISPAAFQGHSTNPSPTEKAIGRTIWIPGTIPKGEKAEFSKKSPQEHYFSELFLNPKLFWKGPIRGIPGGLKPLGAQDRSPAPSQPRPAPGGTRTDRNCFKWAQINPPNSKGSMIEMRKHSRKPWERIIRVFHTSGSSVPKAATAAPRKMKIQFTASKAKSNLFIPRKLREGNCP